MFCRCDPQVAAQRARARATQARHPIHRDVINPALLDSIAHLAATTTPLQLTGGTIVNVDTTEPLDQSTIAAAVTAAVASNG